MLKVKREEGMRRCFAKVSESRHSPLVLVGAPTQGCSSPLDPRKDQVLSTGWFFDTPSQWITHNRSQLELGHPQALRMIIKLQSPPSHLGDGDHQE